MVVFILLLNAFMRFCGVLQDKPSFPGSSSWLKDVPYRQQCSDSDKLAGIGIGAAVQVDQPHVSQPDIRCDAAFVNIFFRSHATFPSWIASNG